MRTMAAFLAGAFFVVVALVQGLPAVASIRDGLFIVVGCALISLGAWFRITALGSLHKKKILATTGVYSLCRHPLYLGSMLITFGYCSLLGRWAPWTVAGVYFAVFYPLTIIWEEIRLDGLYGSAHELYARQIPLILPRGRWMSGDFSWRQARKNGATRLLITLLVLGAVVAWLRFTPTPLVHGAVREWPVFRAR